MIKQRISVFLVFLLFFLQIPAFAQNTAGRAEVFPRINPEQKALDFFRSNPRDYSWKELAKISLWASSGNVAESHLQQILGIAEAIRTSPQLPSGDRERAEFVLEFMHRNLLRVYSLHQTRVDTMLTNGRFNCVSSSALYMILAKSIGLNLSGVMTRDHAFVMIHIDGENIDVETTNIHGFDPGNRREFHDAFGRITGFVYVPPLNYRDRQTIAPIELVSLILTNRIAELESRNRFAEAIPLAIDRAALLNGSSLTASGNVNSPASIFPDPYMVVLDRLFNYGAFLLRSRREEESLRWAAYTLAVFPYEDRWSELNLAAVNNRINRFVQANQITEAKAFLENHKNVLSPADHTNLETMLIDTGLLSRANRIRSAADGDSVAAAIEEARINQSISDARANELLTFTIQRTASILSAAPGRDWVAAINYIEGAIERFGSNRELERILQNYRNNRAVDFHNRFAAAWNRRNFDEAIRILDEGLSYFPDDRQLLRNRETVERANNR